MKLELLHALHVSKITEVLFPFWSRCTNTVSGSSSNQRFGLNHDEAIEIADAMEGIFVDQKGLVLLPRFDSIGT